MSKINEYQVYLIQKSPSGQFLRTLAPQTPEIIDDY
jgi:hypothetical protein